MGYLIITYMSFMFFPLFILPALFFLRFRPTHIALLVIIPFFFLLAWGGRNALQSEWQLLNPSRAAATWGMRAIHAELQDPLDPLRCIWVEYVSRDLSQAPDRICRPENMLPVEWMTAFPNTIAGSRTLQKEAHRRIFKNFPMYLWGTLIWSMEFHFPFLNGWGRFYNILACIGAIIIYTGCLISLVRIKKLWRHEYWLFLFPIFYGTALFSLTLALPRYRMPILFCYVTIAAIGYSSLNFKRCFLRVSPPEARTNREASSNPHTSGEDHPEEMSMENS